MLFEYKWKQKNETWNVMINNLKIACIIEKLYNWMKSLINIVNLLINIWYM